jgi:hypothetical protein
VICRTEGMEASNGLEVQSTSHFIISQLRAIATSTQIHASTRRAHTSWSFLWRPECGYRLWSTLAGSRCIKRKSSPVPGNSGTRWYSRWRKTLACGVVAVTTHMACASLPPNRSTKYMYLTGCSLNPASHKRCKRHAPEPSELKVLCVHVRI